MILAGRALRQIGGSVSQIRKSSSNVGPPETGVSNPMEQQHFTLKMAVTNYSPEEVSIKVVNGYLVIEGKHEESGPNGRTTKEFTKWLKMPEDVDMKTLEHKVSSDGILNLTARRKTAEEATTAARSTTDPQQPQQ